MKKLILVALMASALAGCTKTVLVPQVYMPRPPEILMQDPKDLNTIKPVEEAPDERI